MDEFNKEQAKILKQFGLKQPKKSSKNISAKLRGDVHKPSDLDTQPCSQKPTDSTPSGVTHHQEKKHGGKKSKVTSETVSKDKKGEEALDDNINIFNQWVSTLNK